MSYFVVMLEVWCLLWICLALGRRVVALLPPVIQRTIGFYVAPILGLAVLVLFATLYGWISPFRWVYSFPLTLIAVVISLIVEPKKQILWRDGLFLSVFALLCALPVVAPILRYSGYNPLTDIFTYLAQGQWLQHHPFAEKVVTSGYYPTLTQIASYQGSGCRMGGSFFLAYVQSLFALTWSYDAYIPTVALGFVTGCLSIGGMIRQIVPVKRIVILALACLPGLLSNGFVFGAEWGFFPQTYGLAFAAGVGALFPCLMVFLMHHSPRWFHQGRYVFPLALCTAALLFAYNEPFPLFAVAMGLFVFLTGYLFWNKTRHLFGFLVTYGVETLLLINYESIRIVKSIYQTLSISHGAGEIGWPVLWAPIQFIAFAFGMKSPFSHPVISMDSFISEILAPIILVMMLAWFVRFMRIRPKRRSMLSFLFCVELVLLVFGLKFRYAVPNKSLLEIGHTFLQFKLAKYAAPFSLALLGSLAAMVWLDFKRQRPYLLGLYGLVFALGLYWHVGLISQYFTEPFLIPLKQQQDPFSVLLKLRAAVSNISPDQVIHVQLGPAQSKLRQMVAYVLYDRKISSDYRDDGYILGHLPPQDANMSLDGARGLIVMKEPAGHTHPNQQIVGPFVIQKPPFRYFLMGKQEGGYHTESNKQGDAWNWVSQSIDFPFVIVGDCPAVTIKFQIETHHESSTFHITLKNNSGAALATYVLQTSVGKISFESPPVALHGDKRVILHVETDSQPVQLSKKDGRQAAFMIKNVMLF